MSVPSPETLSREAGEVRCVIAQAGTGVEPLVIVIEAAEELREDELEAIVEATAHASRHVLVPSSATPEVGNRAESCESLDPVGQAVLHGVSG